VLGQRGAERLNLGVLAGDLLNVGANRVPLVDDERERPGHPGPDTGVALVSRDRREPRGRLSRLGPAQHVPMGGKEDLLGRVLGLVRVP
jgi:hypothetical protein